MCRASMNLPSKINISLRSLPSSAKYLDIATALLSQMAGTMRRMRDKEVGSAEAIAGSSQISSSSSIEPTNTIEKDASRQLP